MKTFVELVQEIKKSFDKDDRTVLANLEDSIELTSTASTPHAVGTYLIYNKVIYEVIKTIQTGDTLTPGTNITVADDIMSLLDKEVVTRSELGAHNLFDGYFRNGLLAVNRNYTNRVIDRDETLPNSTVAVSKYYMFGAYLPAGSYVISVNGSDYVSINRVAIAGTDCIGVTVHLRPSYAFTSVVDGWNYFSIERDAGESDYSDIDFEGHDLKIMITSATDSDLTYRPYVPTNAQLLSYKDNGVLGAKNFGRPINSVAYNGLTLVTDSNGITTVSGTASSSGGRLSIKSDNFVLKKGTYKIVGIPNDTTKYLDLLLHDSSNNVLAGWGNTQATSQPDTVTLTTDTVCFVGVDTYNGTAYGTGAFKFGFNIQLASDTDPTYQPYAMTNKELTDVAEQTIGGYVLKSYSSVTVTADGTKTNKTLLNELYAAISQLFTNNPNSYIKVLTLRTGSNYYPIYVVPQLRSIVVTNWVFQGFTFGSTNYINSFSVESSNSSAIRFTLDTGTKEDISTDIPSSGTTFIVQYEIYKQIS